MVTNNKIDFCRFANKKVFITGHTGFKGSWLFYWLQQLGAIVKGFALAPETNPSLFTHLFANTPIDSVIGDINNIDRLKEELLSFQPDYIFHLAAQPLVRRSYKIPIDTFQTNIIGTANILESLRTMDKSCVCILITTDKVYQNKEWNYPYRETDRLGGCDPYSASKACCELVIASYRNSFFNPSRFSEHKKIIMSSRAGNVIGGGDWSEDRLVPDIIFALNKGIDIEIRNPLSLRPWQHVMEPLAGYMSLALLAADDANAFLDSDKGAWNFGPFNEDNLPVIDVVHKAISIWGKGQIKLNVDPEALHEAKLLKLDISRAVNELKWKPKFNANTAIEKTINWYKSFYDGEDARSLVDKDLAYYASLNG